MTDERTDGQTEQGNNNLPELSLESAGIIICDVTFSSLFKHYIKIDLLKYTF